MAEAAIIGAQSPRIHRYWREIAAMFGCVGIAIWLAYAGLLIHASAIHWNDWLHIWGMLWTLSFGVLLAYRRPDSAQVRLLSAALILYGIFDGMLVFGEHISPDARLHGSLIVDIAEVGIAFSSCVLMARFASSFGRPLTLVRQTAEVFVYVAAAATPVASVLLSVIAPNKMLFAFTDPGHYTIPRAAALLCGLLAIAATRGEERQRVGWPFASLGVLYVTSIAGFVGALPQNAYDISVQLALFIMPLGLTYSALSRRLFDIGFVINSAAVFAGVSAIVVGSFALLDWALGKWFEQASSEAGLAANVALALGFGVSLRYVHGRVDRFVDTVFFKKRHDDVNSLKRFAREAALITNRDTLLERTEREILEHSEVSSASILLLDGSSEIAENDAAILAMRTWHDPVELHGYRTSLRGEYAFPMLAHGSLLGILVCGEKKTGEAFAPDEVEALKLLAHGVGIALDGLTRSASDSIASLHAAIDALRAELIGRLDRIAVP